MNLGIFLVFLAVAPCEGIAQVLATDGQVIVVDPSVVQIKLVSARAAYLGAPIYIFERKTVAGRSVDVRVATLQTLRGSADTLYAVAPSSLGIPTDIQTGQLVVVNWPDEPGLVEVSQSVGEVDVAWNGFQVGRSPLFIEVFPGAFTFRYSKSCFEPEEETITIDPDGSWSAAPSLRAVPSAGDLLRDANRTLNAVEDEDARTAAGLLVRALQTQCYGGLEPAERTHAEYLLETAQTRVGLVEFARAGGRTQEQIRGIVGQYIAIRRQTEGVPLDSIPLSVPRFVETLRELVGDYPAVTELYRTYVLQRQQVNGR